MSASQRSNRYSTTPNPPFANTTDDQAARDRYGRSARQLRRLRQAVLSGALRRRAEQLGVDLPAEFVDRPMVGPPTDLTDGPDGAGALVPLG